MSEHLSERQVAEWALGGRDPETDRHAAYCEPCRAELERTAGALAAFRQSAREWSERELDAATPGVWKIEAARARNAFRALRWAGAAAVLVVGVALSSVAWRARREPVTNTAAADAMLLKQIDADVSQTVPDSMEPLVKLVSWNAPASGSGSAQN